MLPPISLSPVDAIIQEENPQTLIDSAVSTRLFEDDTIQSLWAQGVVIDEDWRRARDSVRDRDRSSLPEIAQKLKQISQN